MKLKAIAIVAVMIIAATLSSGTASAADRRVFPGAWYTDARPNGTCVSVMQGQHVKTCDGRTIGLTAGGDPLFVRLSRDGSRFAGMGWGDGIIYEFVNGGWVSNGPGFGNRGVIYDANDQLRIVRGPGEHSGSIGWRFLSDEGALLASWETYDPTTPYARAHGITGLWEYTKRGDIYCGQGGQGLQCLVGPNKRRVQVEPGDAQFVNFNREGDNLSFAAAKLAQREAVVIFMTVAELNALPTYEEPKPELMQCGDGKDNDGDGLVDMADPGCKAAGDNDEFNKPIVIEPTNEKPSCAGERALNDNGSISSPCGFFYQLVGDGKASDYVNVMRNLGPSWYAKGQGQQNDSGGTPRSRLFLSTAICPSAAPNPNDATEMRLGVKQDERCWDVQGRTADVVQNDAAGNPVAWTWAERGSPAFQTFVPGDKPPTGKSIPLVGTRLPDGVCSILGAARDKYPTPMPSDDATYRRAVSDVLNRTAWLSNGGSSDGDWGLSTKKGGNRCANPGSPTNTEIACDIIHHKPSNLIWDVLVAADPGSPTATACGDALGTMSDGSRPWAPPSKPEGVVVDPDPEPDPAIAELKARIKVLEQALADAQEAATSKDNRVVELETERDGLKARIDELNREVEELKSRPVGTCHVSGPGWVRQLFGIRCEVR